MLSVSKTIRVVAEKNFFALTDLVSGSTLINTFGGKKTPVILEVLQSPSYRDAFDTLHLSLYSLVISWAVITVSQQPELNSNFKRSEPIGEGIISIANFLKVYLSQFSKLNQ